MRAYHVLTSLLCVAAVVWLIGCAKLKEPGPAASAVAPTSGVHPAGWVDTASTQFHGLYLKNLGYNPATCAGCHGTNFEGGTSRVSCFACHPSVPHQTRFAQTGGHQGYMRDRFFPLAECQRCHGTSYTGGVRVNVSCEGGSCHADRNGTAKSPEACNTCHGDFRAPATGDFPSYAPPKSVAGDSSFTIHNVGAHQPHVRANDVKLGMPVRCSGCHTVPSSVSAPGHIDAPPAEVNITSALALTPSDGVTPAPTYNPTTYTCSGVYCHGNFRVRKPTPAEDPSGTRGNAYIDSVITGSMATPKWTDGAAGAACGFCHALPPTGHRDFGALCGNCHVGVIAPTANVIADTTKHMNGLIDVYGQQRPF